MSSPEGAPPPTPAPVPQPAGAAEADDNHEVVGWDNAPPVGQPDTVDVDWLLAHGWRLVP